MSETTGKSEATGKKDEAGASTAAPERVLPSQDEIAAWIEGAELPSIGALFDQVDTKKFDLYVTLMQKQELLPQHWQVISRTQVPADADFDSLPLVERLRDAYDDPETADERLRNLEMAWEELRGKQPALWTAADLMAVLRRVIDKERPVDFTHLLSAVRDVWLAQTLPHGRRQLDMLASCLSLVRDKTKK